MRIVPIALALLAAPADAFVVRSAATTTTTIPTTSTTERGLWVDEQSFSTTPLPTSTTTTTTTSSKTHRSLEARVRACLAGESSDAGTIQSLLVELEDLQNMCTEEGNQTLEECDVVLKDERDAWRDALEEELAREAAAAMVAYLRVSSPTPADELAFCLPEDSPATKRELEALLERLEATNNECTEEGNQTSEECDLAAKDEREAHARTLRAAIDRPSAARCRARLDRKGVRLDLGDLTSMLASLEATHHACTEEGNQTNDECDVWAAADREELLARIEAEICDRQQASAANTERCLKYSLCDTAALRRTLEELQHLGDLCTEEGNQTKRFCSLEAMAQREELAEKLQHELDLAAAAVRQTRSHLFQI